MTISLKSADEIER